MIARGPQYCIAPPLSILVIGAGPAGSAAAFHLARAGFAVTLAEARPFPRAKVCGEFISPAATPLLEEVVPAPALRAAGARRITRFALQRGDRDRSWPLPAPGWALSRGPLDTLLRDAAAAAGAIVLQPCTVRRVEYGATGVVAHATRDGAALPPIAADLVLHADGSGRHDPAGPLPHDPALVALKCHLGPGPRAETTHRPAEPIDPSVRLRAFRAGYVGTMEVEGGLTVCAMAVRKRRLAAAGGRPDRLAAAVCPVFAARRRVGPWLSCGVARSGYRRPGHPRSFRLGNAAAAVDPVGGEGIGLALWAGATLAAILAEDRPSSLDALAACQRRFAERYRARLRTRLPACRAAAWALERPALVRALGPALTLPGAGIGGWYRLTGKSGARPATVGPCAET